MKKQSGIALALSLLFLSGCSSVQAATTAASSTALSFSATPQLTDFHSISVDVLAANVHINTGEDWSVSYRFSDKETLQRCDVEDGTLYVETSFDPAHHFRHKDWYVTITVPEGTVMQEIDASSVSGEVLLRNVTCDSASLDSTSGQVRMQNVTAQEAELSSVSGRITAENLSADQLEAKTTTGDLTLAGSFGSLEAKTISAKTDISGEITQEAEAESISGNISLSVTHPLDLDAATIGTIQLNGKRAEVPLSVQTGAPEAELKSVSGKITITTAK